MSTNQRNPAVRRVRSWAEDVRGSELERALRQLTRLNESEKNMVDSLSRKIVIELLAPSEIYTVRGDADAPEEKRAALLCGIFEMNGGDCVEAACAAAGYCKASRGRLGEKRLRSLV